MKLVEIYYNTSNQRLIEQLNLAEPLVNSLPQSSDKNHKLSQLYYYKGEEMYIFKTGQFL